MSALIVINLQNDFCGDGLNGVDKAREILPIVCRIRDQFDIVVYVMDWHPKDHISFKTKEGDQEPHCIAGTKGAQLVDVLIQDKKDIIIHKGTLVMYDSSSAFYNAQTIHKKTNLGVVLRHHKIKDLYICGVVLERDIFDTAIDARLLHYNVKIIEDACRGVDAEKAIVVREALVKLNVEFVHSKDIEKIDEIPCDEYNDLDHKDFVCEEI